ncbi:MAG TPA: hypothetical protein VMX94_11965 [Armatimonadota bacterium]|nr:hypothetical protein [Armatimonadota bacterium]
MPKVNPRWGECIRNLLQRHNLSYRDAVRKGTRLFSHTSLMDWAKDDIVPVYVDQLPKFLELISSRQEAAECLQAAGIPLPAEWPRQEGDHPDPMLVREQMAEYLVQTQRLTPEEAEKVLSELQEAPTANAEDLRERKSA